MVRCHRLSVCRCARADEGLGAESFFDRDSIVTYVHKMKHSHKRTSLSYPSGSTPRFAAKSERMCEVPMAFVYVIPFLISFPALILVLYEFSIAIEYVSHRPFKVLGSSGLSASADVSLLSLWYIAADEPH